MKKVNRERQLRLASIVRARFFHSLRKRSRKFIRDAAGLSRLPELRIVAPSEFSFSRNYDETVKCLVDLKNATVRRSKNYPRRSVYLDLSEIKSLSVAGALVLAAEIDRWRIVRKSKLRPRSIKSWKPEVRALLADLGFFRLLGTGPDPQEPDFDSGDVVVLELVGCDTLDRDQITSIKNHLRFIAQIFRHEAGLYEALVEAALNSLTHAYPEGHDFVYHPLSRWWATASWNPQRSEVKLIVYDQGVGIAETLPRSGMWERVTAQLSSSSVIAPMVKDQAGMIEAALQVSRTSQTDGHGQGLADIVLPVDTTPGARLRILSGKGEILYEPRGRVKKLEHARHIGGTLIEWTLPVTLDLDHGRQSDAN